MDIKFDHVQLVIFSPGFIITEKLKIANAINSILKDLFNADPVIMPVPADAISEIPRMTLSSKDGKYILNIAKNRVDFVFANVENSGEYELPVLGFFENFLTISKFFKEELHSQIIRCSIVSGWVIKLEKQVPTDVLLTKYIRSGTPIMDPIELELRYLIRESINEFEVNKWTVLRSSREKNGPVSLLIDMNTLSERQYDFNNDSLQKFYNSSSVEINKTVNDHLKIMEAE